MVKYGVIEWDDSWKMEYELAKPRHFQRIAIQGVNVFHIARCHEEYCANM